MGQDLVLDSIPSFKQRTRCVTLHHDIPSSKLTTLRRIFFVILKRVDRLIFIVLLFETSILDFFFPFLIQ